MSLNVERNPHLFIGDVEVPDEWAIHEIMYQLPGYEQPNFELYTRARERNKDELEKITLKQRVSSIEDAKSRFDLLKTALDSDKLKLQRTAAQLVNMIDDEKLRRTIQQSIDSIVVSLLNSNEPTNQLEGGRMVQFVPDEVLQERLNMFKESIMCLLQDDDIDLQTIGAQMIASYPDKEEQFALQKEVVALCETYLASDTLTEQEKLFRLLTYLPERDVSNLLPKIFADENLQPLRSRASIFLKRLSTHNSESILLQALESHDHFVVKEAIIATNRIFTASSSDNMSSSERLQRRGDSAVQLLLNSPEGHNMALELVQFIHDPEFLCTVIERLLDSDHMGDVIAGTRSIKYLLKHPEFRNRSVKLLQKLLHSKEYKILSAVIPELRHVPEPEKKHCMNLAFAIVEHYLMSENIAHKKLAASWLYYLNTPNTEKLFEIVEQDQLLLETLFFSRLYPEQEKNNEMNSSAFYQREKIQKTGSDMTVLREGELEKKVLIRHIKKRAFLGWKTAFEDSNVWLENGFDYVPVEPIQYFSFKNNHVDVYAGVFDIDLKHWLLVSGGRFKYELIEKRKEIMSVLKELGVRHGDLHQGNFFLQFHRREDGRIDTLQEPNLYVGDFDKSKIRV